MDGRKKQTSHEIRGTGEPPLWLPLQVKTRLLLFVRAPFYQSVQEAAGYLHAALTRAIKYRQTSAFFRWLMIWVGHLDQCMQVAPDFSIIIKNLNCFLLCNS